MTDVLSSAVAAPARASTEDWYQAALTDVLTRVPYSSATEFHRAVGSGKVDDRLGVACIRQSIRVADRAVELGAPSPILLKDGRHVAAVFVTAGDVVVLDPYLLHLTPITFPASEVLRGASEVTVLAAPVRTDAGGDLRPARLAARYSNRSGGGFVIRLMYSKFSPTLGRYVVARHFTLRSENVFDAEAFSGDIRSILAHPEQTSMSVRAYARGSMGTVEAILPLAGFAQRGFCPRDVWLRGADGRAHPQDSAPTLWGQLEDLLERDAAQIRSHLLGAAEIYQEIADPGVAVAPYDLEPE